MLKKPIVLTLIRSKDTAPQFEQINPGSKEIYKALYNREKEIFKKQKQAYQKVKKNRTMTSSSIKPKSVTKVFSIKSSLKKPSKAKKQLECGVIIVD